MSYHKITKYFDNKCSLTNLLPVFGPSLNALVCTSIVVVCSNAYRGGNKVAFQSFFLVAAVSWAIAFVVLKQDDLNDIFNAFAKLDYYLRFALSVVVIFVAYFGGGMYLGGPSGWFRTVVSKPLVSKTAF